jgi:hypothetical protein
MFATLPFFAFLRDESVPVCHRLAFLPCIAPFILTFGDLNRWVLRVEPAVDVYQEVINRHTYEDDHHWPWYLEDFTKLGHDLVPQASSDVMRFLWSDATVQSRLLGLRLAHEIWRASPVLRLALIEAIEETGNVFFSQTAQLAKTFQEETGIELRYCGDFHFQRESGHAINSEHVQLPMIELDGATREEALRCTDRVFEYFTGCTAEWHAFALAQRPREVSSLQCAAFQPRAGNRTSDAFAVGVRAA